MGVKNRGCSGLAYNLEYVDKPGQFDEEVVQDGVKVLIDSKALFSIIGSEMDWEEGRLRRGFVFRNPNISESTFFLYVFFRWELRDGATSWKLELHAVAPGGPPEGILRG